MRNRYEAKSPVAFLLAQSRRQWSHLCAIVCKKDTAALAGDTEALEALHVAAVQVDADLADTEQKLKRAIYAEEHPKDWKDESWAKA